MHHSKDKLSQRPGTQNFIESSTLPSCLKAASFGILNQNIFPRPIAYISTSFHILQTICLLAESTFYSFPDSQTSIEDAVQFIVSIILARNLVAIEEIDVFQLSVYVMIAIYMLCILGIGIIFLVSVLKKKDVPIRISRNWKNLGHLHFYWFFIPVHNILTELILQVIHTDLDPMVTWTIFSVSLIAEIINLTFCICQFPVSFNIKTLDPLATSENIFLKWCLFKRVCISFLNLLIIDQRAFKIPVVLLNFIYLGFTAGSSIIFTYTIPFYQKDILKFFCLEVGTALCFGLVNSILSILYALDIEVSISYAIVVVLIITPCYLKFILNFLFSKLSTTVISVSQNLIEEGVVQKLNKYWFIQSIYDLKYVLESKIQANFLSDRYPKKMISQIGHVKFFYGILFNREADFTDINNVKNDLRIFILKFMESWLRKHPKDHLVRIVLADLMCNDFDQIYGSYGLLSQVLISSKKTSLRLSALKVKDNIQRTIADGGLEETKEIDLSLFFEGSQVYEELRIRIDTQLKQSESFFKIIQEKNPDLYSMTASSCDIQEARKQVERFWSRIPQEVTETYLPMCLAYGAYKSGVNYEYKEGNEILHRYYNLIRRRLQLKNNSEINEETLFSPNNVALLMNSVKTDFGTIRYCSKNAKKVFNTGGDALVGKNIKEIMSPFFQRIHDKFLTKKLESSQTMLKSKYISTFALDKDGFIFPVNLLITLFPWITNGVFFSGIIRPIRTWMEYILVDESGFVDSCSKAIAAKLNLPSAKRGAKIHISRLCKSFGNLNAVLNTLHPSSSFLKNDSAKSLLDIYSLNIWRRESGHLNLDSPAKPPEILQQRRGITDIQAPLSPLSPYSLFPLTPRRKSRFSSSPSQNNMTSKEVENTALEIMSLGKVLKFKPYNEEPLQEILKSVKLNKGIASAAEPSSLKSKSTVMSGASEAINSSLNSLNIYYCRVEVKRYEGKVLKVIVMDEVSADYETSRKRKKNEPRRRTSAPRRPSRITRRANRRSTVEYMAEKMQTAKFNNNSQEETSEKHSDKDAKSDLSGIGKEEFEVESEDAIPQEKARRGREVMVPNFADGAPIRPKKTFTWKIGSTERGIPSKDSDVDSSESDSKSDDSGSTVNISPFKKGLFGADSLGKIKGPFDRALDQKNQFDHYNSMESPSNHAGALNADSEGDSTSKILFEIGNTMSSIDEVSSIEKGDQTSGRARGNAAKNMKRFSLSEYVPTLKFYRYSQAKILCFWLIVCLSIFVSSGLIMFSIATASIPVVEESITFMRTSINRVLTLTMIVRYSASFAVFASNPTPLRLARMPVYQESLKLAINEFMQSNLLMSEKVNLFNLTLQNHFFDKNIKIYTSDFENRENLSNYLVTDTFTATALIATHSSVVSNTKGTFSLALKYSLQIVVENAYNDLLISLRKQPYLIKEAIQVQINNIKRSQSLLVILTSASFLGALILTVTVFVSGYFEVRKFLKYFTFYPQKEIQLLIKNIEMYRTLLDSHMQDEKVLKEFKNRDHFASKYNGDIDRTKKIQQQKLAFSLMRKVLILILFFSFPVATLIISKSLFETNFQDVQSTLDQILKLKQLSLEVILCISQVGLYTSLPHIKCNNINVSSSLEQEMNNLSDMILDINTNFNSELYPLLYQDFCIYIQATSNHTNCYASYNGIATSGIIGATLSVQKFIQTMKDALDAGQIQKVLTLGDLYMIETYNLIAIYQRQAIEYFEEKSVDGVNEELNTAKTITIVFIGMGLIVAVVMLGLTICFVYIPSKRERESVSSILSLFPSRMVMMNKFLASFLQKESKELNELFRKRQY